MTQQIHINESNFSRDEMDIVQFLAARRCLALVVERALKDAIKNDILPVVKDAKQQIASFKMTHPQQG